MYVNVENLVSISEANQDFSKVARLVDERGTAVILKNNAPRYVVMEYGLTRDIVASDEEAQRAADAMLDKYLDAFREMACDD